MATMADVARRAGVSVSTVSYALSGTRPISLTTRRRIEQAMLDLEYTPNAFARGLKSKRSHIISLLLPARPGSPQPSSLEYILGAADHAQRCGYHLMLWTADVEAVDDLTQFAGQGLVDGALLMEVRPEDPRIQVLVDAGVPFTMIGRNADPAGLDFVDADAEQTAEAAVEHLLGLGHRRLGFVGGPSVRNPVQNAILQAVKRADAGMNVDLVQVEAECSTEGGRNAFAWLLHSSPKITAIIVANEQAVSGLIRASADFGRRIPDDLSMMCLDMPAHVAELITPPMTTAGPSAAEIGRAAVDMLLRRLDGDVAPARQLLFRGELNLRGSCAPVRDADHQTASDR
ncbi:LacI family DNA-binding transcriptional regulator [Kineosporia mesophila]|uniref:LacI family DNA-binding transcriptional regulator n=1 Tax=Kineosporia mesophila TaxID=566012 RepID=A0ABP6ZL97_9ACTN